MSDETALQVNDQCHDGSRLAVGMKVFVHNYRDNGQKRGRLLLRRRYSFEWVSDDDYVLTDGFIATHGVTILALPEEAPRTSKWLTPGHGIALPPGAVMVDEPAAPSIDAVPVGSKWRVHTTFRVLTGFLMFSGTKVTINEDGNPRYSSGHVSAATHAEILAHATRIDEPAGAGKCAFDEVSELTPELVAAVNRVVSMPPARCAPGCAPSRACRITIPVTDKGTRYECPALKEAQLPNAWLAFEGDFAAAKKADRAEARAMRDQRWEAMNAGPMVGRYRFDRRPR